MKKAAFIVFLGFFFLLSTTSKSSAQSCEANFHCSIPDVLCLGGDTLTLNECETACGYTGGTWVGQGNSCYLNYTYYAPDDDDYSNPLTTTTGYCCAPNSPPANWNEWSCVWAPASHNYLELCYAQDNLPCSNAAFYDDRLCDQFGARIVGPLYGFEHPYCEPELPRDDPLTGLNHGYCAPLPEHCWECASGPTCLEHDMPYFGVYDCLWEYGYYYSPEECGIDCGALYTCTDQFECVRSDTGEYSSRVNCETWCISDCTGSFSGAPGHCQFIGCSPGEYWDGSNPPFENGCPFLNSCCTKDSDYWTNRPALEVKCTTGRGEEGINTAVGCVPVTNPTDFLAFILTWALGVGGGTAFILIIVAAFLIMTSGGDPQKTKTGKELLTAAITGLLLIIFSVYILDVIGIRILRIPGLV